MFLGERAFTRGADIQEYRLFLLIQHAFGSRIPGEVEVCRLFQTTSSRSRSLVRAVMSKYQYSLDGAITDTLRDVLESADVSEAGRPVVLAIHSANLVDELNRTLSAIDPSLPSVTRRKGSVSTYEIKRSSYSRLCELLGVGSGRAAGE